MAVKNCSRRCENSFCHFYDSSLHLSTLTRPNIVCSKQFISFKQFMLHTCYASNDVRLESSIYECWLIIFEHADLSKPWHPVLFFWTAPWGQHSFCSVNSENCVSRKVFKWGKVKGWKCFSSGACIVYLSRPQAAAADTNANISCCIGKNVPDTIHWRNL